MSVMTETTFEIDVPVKLVAKAVTNSIARDYSVMSVGILKDAKGKLHLYLDDSCVFSEPQEG